jgi:hypothetical protein
MTDIYILTRNAAAALVEREERRTGSLMTAYEIVGSTIGKSSTWVRRFIGSSPDAKFDPVGFNILAQYDRLCVRVEDDNAQREARIAGLKGQIDAATEGSVAEVLAVARGAAAPEEKGEGWMTFRVGQKVVCVDASPGERSGERSLTKGAVYIVTGLPHRHGMFVCGAPTPNPFGWDFSRFRPVVERKTDISIFKKMLRPVSKELCGND